MSVARRGWKFVALVLLCSVVLVAGTGCTTRELSGMVLGFANNERAERGIAPLQWDDNAAAKAQAWAEYLAASRTIAHSRLTDGIEGNWTVLAENVGFADSVGAAHAGFMNSPKHRATLLSPAYSAVGVGVAENGGLFYVVQVYRG